jgi:NADP-dependent 3-hydroxy acid dehydrogenase YdfG
MDNNCTGDSPTTADNYTAADCMDNNCTGDSPTTAGNYTAPSSTATEPTTLIFACRNKAKAQAAMDALWHRFPNTQNLFVHFLLVDLSDPASVVKACHEYRQRFPCLDVLYANAGTLLIDGVDVCLHIY